MPLSAPAGLRGSAMPPEENPPRIVIVRSTRRGSVARPDTFVSIDIEDDPESVALSSERSDTDPSEIDVVVASLGEPHPSSSQAATAARATEAVLEVGTKGQQKARKTQSAGPALQSRVPFQVNSPPSGPERNRVRRQDSGESVSISSGTVNQDEGQPEPSRVHHSMPSSPEDEREEQERHETSLSVKLNPNEAKKESLDLDACKSKKLSARMRMKKLLFGTENREAKSEGIELHEIKSSGGSSWDDQPERNALDLSDSYKNLFTTARDLASATTSFAAPSPTELTHDEEEGDGSSDPGGNGDSSGAESSTGTGRPRNWRMRGLVRMQMAARGMREDARRNAFVGTLSVFQTIIQFGYYLGVIPFRVTFDGTKYVMKTSRPRQIIVFIMLLLAIWCEARKAVFDAKRVNIKDKPSSLFTATEEIVRVWLLIAYAVVLYWKQGKFLLAFDDFTHDFRRPGRNESNMTRELRAKHIAFFFCCIYLVLANWVAWTRDIFTLRFWQFLTSRYDTGIDIGGLPDDPENQVYFVIVSIIFWAMGTYKQIVKFYMEGMLWASAWTLYSIERKTRSYTMHEGTFEIKMGTQTFRCVIKLVRDLNRTLGPLRVVQFLVLIPYLVNIAYRAGNGHFDFLGIFKIPLQVGHFLVAAEASANMKNLIQHIVLFKINLTPEQRQNQLQWNELNARQNFFSMIASTPIALEGMDFFEVSYVVLGNIAGSVITYVLVILDWRRETGALTAMT